VPFFERYFLGGAYSLRGFRYRDVSPQERGIRGVGSEPVGGNTYYLAGVEYSIPIIERLRFALFYDMGNVYYESFEFKPSEYYSDYGVGIRLDIPRIGPLRFDYGIPLEDPAGRGGSGRFNFTVGYKREF
jgi:outer membrane protein insertion porin family